MTYKQANEILENLQPDKSVDPHYLKGFQWGINGIWATMVIQKGKSSGFRTLVLKRKLQEEHARYSGMLESSERILSGFNKGLRYSAFRPYDFEQDVDFITHEIEWSGLLRGEADAYRKFLAAIDG